VIRRVTVALTALALGALGVACGDDGAGGSGGQSSDEGQEYVDALVAASEDEAATAEDIECYARSLVEGVGVDVLREARVTPEDMSDPDASLNDFGITLDDGQVDAFWGDLNQCMDVRAFFFGSLAADGELSDETVDCLGDTMDDDLIRRFIVGAIAEGEDAFQEDDQLTSDLAGVFSECPGALPEN
jgi:hypothetical protein